MYYEEAREFINDSNQYGCVPGLETITELLKQLGNPQEQLKVIHVAGTNGKGSTSAFLSSILTAAGYVVGRYISPAVFSYRERIQISRQIIEENKPIYNKFQEDKNYSQDKKLKEINNQNIDKGRLSGDNLFDKQVIHDDKGASDFVINIDYITKQGVCDTIEKIKPVCEQMVLQGFSHPTSFEIETAMAMLYLLWEQVDVAVIEVGLGGRLDATNVIKHPVCSVITSISMDHMQFLGDSLELIAGEKAGIIKKDAPTITCKQEPEVRKVLEKVSKDRNSTLTIAEIDNVKDIKFTTEETVFFLDTIDGEQKYIIRLLGEYQIGNAVLAIQTARIMNELGYPIDENAIKKGLYDTKWSGRFERIASKPYVIIDGAHNEDAALRLRKSIQLYFTNRRIIYMIGVLADKDYKSILKLTAPLAEVIITLTPNNSRALPSAELAKVAKLYCNRVLDAGNLQKAVKLVYEEAKEEDVIIAFGSLSYLGELVNTFGIRKEEEANDR